MSTKCLICYGDFHQLINQYDSGGCSGGDEIKIEAINSEDNLSLSENSVLSKHLDVIFILRNIFEVPVTKLGGYLKNCPKVDQWICICDKCREIVDGYRRIYEDLVEISRKYQEAKLGIVKIVKESYSDDYHDHGIVLADITNECRRFINNYAYPSPHNPFKDGDLKASELARLTNDVNWIWTMEPGAADDFIGTPPPVSPADFDDEPNDHHWSGGDDDTDQFVSFVEPKPEVNLQLENKNLTENIKPKRGRGRPRKKPKRLYKPPIRKKKQLDQSKPSDIHISEESADIGTGDVNRDHRSGGSGDGVDDDLVKPESKDGEGGQLRNNKLSEGVITRRGRGRPPKKRIQLTTEDDSGAEENDDLVELKPKDEEQLQNNVSNKIVSPASGGRGRHRGKRLTQMQLHIKELMEEWKPGFKPKPKWKPKKKKRKPAQRQLKYPCPHAPQCTILFSSKVVLDNHLKADHGKQRGSGQRKKYPLEFYQPSKNPKQRLRLKIPSKCESCNKWFKSQDCLRTHIKFSHENRFPYYCKTCGVGKHTKSTLEKHESICSEVKGSIPPETEGCPEEGCTVVVSRATGLEIHFRDKHPEREPYAGCPHCEIKLFTKLGYARHLKSEHKINKPFKCEYCGLECSTQGALDTHKRNSLKCKINYQRRSASEVTIICDICGGNYSSQANLEKHRRSQHEDEFKWRCGPCGKGFEKEDYLNVHLFKRHGIGDGSNLKYRCKVEGCSRICFAPKQFQVHMAMHEGKEPGFTCEECGKQFYGRGGLSQHKRLMHYQKLSGERFKCEVCGGEFGILEYLKRHKRVVHKIFPEKRRQDL